MNHQGVSEIFFEESYTVPADQTAKSLFARLPHGNGYAERLIECLATGYLVAVVEPSASTIEGQSRQGRRCGCADGSNVWETEARRSAFRPTMRTKWSAKRLSR